MMPTNDPRLAASQRCSRCGNRLGTSGPLCKPCLDLIHGNNEMPEGCIRIYEAERQKLDAVRVERERCAKILESVINAGNDGGYRATHAKIEILEGE